MHNSTERGTAAAALAGLFYTSDSTAAHSRRDETKTQGPGPLRRPKGASSPIKKMAAMPYGQQEVKTHSPRSPVSLQSRHPRCLTCQSRAPQRPLASCTRWSLDQAPGIQPAASGVGTPEGPSPSASHGLASAWAPAPRTAAPTSEYRYHPWGHAPWGALAAPSFALSILPPLTNAPPVPLRSTSWVPELFAVPVPRKVPPPPPPPPPAKKPPRAKKPNGCARAASTLVDYTHSTHPQCTRRSTHAPRSRHAHATPT